MKNSLMLAGTFCLILGMYWNSPHYVSKDAVPNVQLIYPYSSSIQDAVVLHGSVTDPCPEKIYAEGRSKVLAVYVEEGAVVEAGQLLLTLERTDEPQAEQTVSVSLLTELQETLTDGDIEGAQTLLQNISLHDFSANDTIVQDKVYNLYSPCNGIIISSSARDGQVLSSLLPCMEISNPENLQIAVTAGEDVIALLKEDMQCAITIPAFEVEQLSGKIEKIAPYAHKNVALTGNSTIETKVSILPLENRGVLRAGYRATAKVFTARREQALLLPYEAVMQDETGEYVYKLQGNTLCKQPVQSGSELENHVEICTGITEGDLIVLNPQAEWDGKEIHFAGS